MRRETESDRKIVLDRRIKEWMKFQQGKKMEMRMRIEQGKEI